MFGERTKHLQTTHVSHEQHRDARVPGSSLQLTSNKQGNKATQNTALWGDALEPISETASLGWSSSLDSPDFLFLEFWFSHPVNPCLLSLTTLLTTSWHRIASASKIETFHSEKKDQDRTQSNIPVCPSLFSTWISKALSIAKSYCRKKKKKMQRNVCALRTSVLENPSGIMCYQVQWGFSLLKKGT